ncbi:MAG: hypothetical protein JJU00_00910 [Opitutales bacterium]|nr:hypothetical protein [Opitutales bacterium]
MKKTSLLRITVTAAGFLAAGLALGVWWSPLAAPPEEPPPAPPLAQADPEMRAELRSLESEIGLLEAENRDLRENLARARERVAAPVVEVTPVEESVDAGPELDEAAIALAQRIQSRMESRREARVEALDAMLHLSDEQREQVRALLARRTGPGGWGMGAGERFDMDAAMGEILTDTQFETYLEQSQESIYERAEAAASAGVSRLSDSLDLSADQQAAAYEALHVLTQEALIARETGEDFTYTEALRERFSGILTPEQMEQAETTRMFRPRFGGGRESSIGNP